CLSRRYLYYLRRFNGIHELTAFGCSLFSIWQFVQVSYCKKAENNMASKIQTLLHNRKLYFGKPANFKTPKHKTPSVAGSYRQKEDPTFGRSIRKTDFFSSLKTTLLNDRTYTMFPSSRYDLARKIEFFIQVWHKNAKYLCLLYEATIPIFLHPIDSNVLRHSTYW